MAAPVLDMTQRKYSARLQPWLAVLLGQLHHLLIAEDRLIVCASVALCLAYCHTAFSDFGVIMSLAKEGFCLEQHRYGLIHAPLSKNQDAVL
jgi:hypothetical protein